MLFIFHNMNRTFTGNLYLIHLGISLHLDKAHTSHILTVFSRVKDPDLSVTETEAASDKPAICAALGFILKRKTEILI